MARRCPQWIPREDLVAAGLLGLTEAADRYDDSRIEPFKAFAKHRIRGAVLDELRRGDILPRRVRTLARRIATIIRDLEYAGQPATDVRIAEVLGVTAESYREQLAHLASIGLEPIDDHATLATDDQSPQLQAARNEMLDTIDTASEQLESRDAQLLGLHYRDELTFSEIGDQLGVTASRVCQLVRRAVDRLRDHMEEPRLAA